MISYFPKVYEDELFYSIVSRYHFYIGNVNSKATLLDIYGDINKIATIEFPSDIKSLINKLPEDLGLNEESIILNNTAFPYYYPFLPKKRAMKIKKELINGNGKGIKAQIGFIAGSICKKDGIMYCYQCALKEINEHGEAYFHRAHQLQGVYVCEKHKCYLQKYTKSFYSKLNFMRLDIEGLKPINKIENKNELKQLIKIVKEVKYLLQNNLNKFNQDEIHNMYMTLLKNKGYTTIKNHIRQRKLYEDFKSCYSNKLLDKLESNINWNNQSNWLALITRKPKTVIHPIRHILFIMFLCGSVKQFFNNRNKVEEKCKFPCLNPVSSHYREFVVTKVIISADYKTRDLIGTFECDCGFKYSRRMDADEFRIGRIKEFGAVWEEVLRNKLLSNISSKHSIRKIANIMRCDCKTVVRYAEKLGLGYLLNSSIRFNNVKHSSNKYNIIDLEQIYKKDILKEIRENPQLSRNQLRVKLKKQYIYLYRHDKEWLYKSLPPRKKIIGTNNRSKNWIVKDDEILKKLKKEYENIISTNSRPRITISLLGRKIGKLADIQKNIDKLPNTRDYLQTICETVDKYQLYRVNEVCTKLLKSDKVIKEWKVLRLAGLRNNIDAEVRAQILFYENIGK
ncbi:hypothetical protein FDG42_08830 [Clostridium botulinum]|uniref:TnsD family Tn7-like transposition protein n=1 Tax=Clostridium botulinum TaxID=1491 RepID=UPI000717BA41|nr:TnsD family Tn7-like transposition protein [Clostridium botulinum]MBZ1329747.1 TniQ family protein [Clostridium botulinum]MBZ1333195.1 TniQ family protein [Clostridium botulinum]MBZ1336917.1 TniQ family protein [Clostridium botulinum]MBZ1338975.1 TniQ family protein [Clostridium botulinum]MBZ1343201.1 TniQ family protein [Clostridium botulinum]